MINIGRLFKIEIATISQVGVACLGRVAHWNSLSLSELEGSQYESHFEDIYLFLPRNWAWAAK